MLWESIAEETDVTAMDCSSFQMSRIPSSRRLNMNAAALTEMTVDELSFYDDSSEHAQERLAVSPPPMGLLSPEGSPQRFHIVEKAAPKPFLQPLERQQKLRGAMGTTSTLSSNSPGKSLRMFHSLSTGSMESSMDDEYMEMFEMESLEQNSFGSSNLKFPSDLNSLISGQIKSSEAAVSGEELFAISKTPEMRRPSVRRCLSMTENHQQHQPKTPELLKQIQETATTVTTPFASRLTAERGQHTSPAATITCFKRPDPPSTNASPVQTKRYRGDEKENAMVVRVPLRKSMSMNDAEIMCALARSESTDDLIGDFSMPFALPLMDGRHRDLKSVSSHTVARLLRGEFDEQVSSYKIIDCRYPYEFDGGHIRGAKNLYTQEQIMEEFLTQQKTEQQTRTDVAKCKRNIIIFHCEFSSERGPKMSRFLRNHDRARNTSSYPALDYPEIYLLHNGYKEFYETHAELCDPVAYRPMLEPSYNEAYRHFRAKSKSWNGDGLGGATSRLKKSRSRLLL